MATHYVAATGHRNKSHKASAFKNPHQEGFKILRMITVK